MNAASFFIQHGRLPRLGDDPAPWNYKGWALPYVQLAHSQSYCSNRWEHWLNMRSAGQLIEEPIPRISFSTTNRTALRSIETWLSLLDRHSRWNAMELMIDFLAWGLSVSDEQPRVDADEAEVLYRSIDLVPWLEEPGDYLGAVLAEQHGMGWNPHAFFPTPHELCELLTSMTIGTGSDSRRAAVHDPCCGTGRMLLHASNYSYRLSGQDIDPMMVKVTKINGALYAPWLAFPFPDSLFDQHDRDKPQPTTITLPRGQMELFA